MNKAARFMLPRAFLAAKIIQILHVQSHKIPQRKSVSIHMVY
jgi:hypothetical protein